ncbi:MAG: hypothetical protein H6Q41_2595 [Deltaproteobacteria bacterium]|nr:hypothetical protein [Deltaproteobacteria bacterium]
MLAEGILLRRLIRSLKDWHSMITGRIYKLRFEALLKEEKRLFFVFIEEDSRESKGFFRAKVKDYALYLHIFARLYLLFLKYCDRRFYSNFFISSGERTFPTLFTWPSIASAGVIMTP